MINMTGDDPKKKTAAKDSTAKDSVKVVKRSRLANRPSAVKVHRLDSTKTGVKVAPEKKGTAKKTTPSKYKDRNESVLDDVVSVGARGVGSALGAAAGGAATLGFGGQMVGGVAGDMAGKYIGEQANRFLGFEPQDYDYSASEAVAASVGGPIAKYAGGMLLKGAGKAARVLIGKNPAASPVGRAVKAVSTVAKKKISEVSAKAGVKVKKNSTGYVREVKNEMQRMKDEYNKIGAELTRKSNVEKVWQVRKVRNTAKGPDGQGVNRKNLSNYYEKQIAKDSGVDVKQLTGKEKVAAGKLAEKRLTSTGAPTPKPGSGTKVKLKPDAPVKETTTYPPLASQSAKAPNTVPEALNPDGISKRVYDAATGKWVYRSAVGAPAIRMAKDSTAYDRWKAKGRKKK